MKEITVIHVIDGEDVSFTGYLIAPNVVMDIDAVGPTFLQYFDITDDTVRFMDAVKNVNVTFDGDNDGQVLVDMGANAADMTLGELGLLLLDEKGRI